MNVAHEVELLKEEMRRLGTKNSDGQHVVKFGVLFSDDRCANIFEGSDCFVLFSILYYYIRDINVGIGSVAVFCITTELEKCLPIFCENGLFVGFASFQTWFQGRLFGQL